MERIAQADVFQSPHKFKSELKELYRLYLGRGFLIAIIIHILIIAAYAGLDYYNKLQKNELLKKQKEQRIITLTDLEPPPSMDEDESIPPPKIEENLPAPPKDLSALTPEPVAKEKADIQTIKTQKELEEIKGNISSMGDTGRFTYSGPVKIDEKKVEEKIVKEEKIVEKEKTVYQSFEVEKAPECINLVQVKAMMVYPPLAREAGIEGKVTVKVLVGSEGNVIKVGSITGPEIFHSEVSDKSMQLQFTPGLQNGKPVKVWVTVPFNFKLN